jgi:hypothetical protein
VSARGARRALALAAAGAAWAYLRWGRPRVLNWGATPEEAARALPGDDILPDATLQTTRAVTIAAPPEAVWPWLVQMGPRPRAGVYSYDWIERRLGIDVASEDRILPEYQQLAPGASIGVGSGQRLVARAVEPPHTLVLQWEPAHSTWAFVIEPQADGMTRLLSRNRLPGSGLLFRLAMAGFMEPGSLVMERKMLLGLKQRAERHVAQPAA